MTIANTEPRPDQRLPITAPIGAVSEDQASAPLGTNGKMKQSKHDHPGRRKGNTMAKIDTSFNFGANRTPRKKKPKKPKKPRSNAWRSYVSGSKKR